jgi:hypothetical protein
MPILIPVAVVLVLMAVTLMSRSANSWMVAARQSDAQAARQAAESGMNRVLSTLNPYAKFNTNSYISYLLVSEWQDGANGADGTWTLIANGTTSSEMQTLLRRCGLSARGFHPSHLPPSSYTGLLSGVVGSTGTNAKLRYKVIDYVPPDRPPRSTNMPSWPNVCNVFTSLAGGSAQITVEGTVERPKPGSNGDVVVARYSLTRNLDVQGWPLLDLPASWLTNKIFPGPPVSLRIGNVGTGLDNVQTFVYTTFETDATPKEVDGTLGTFRAQCRSCSPALKSGMTTDIPAGDTDLPRFYPFPNADPSASPRPIAVTLDSTISPELLKKFPFKSAGNNNQNNAPQLQNGCYFNVDANRPNEIDCWINSIGPGITLSVSTEAYPVNLIILGDVGQDDNLDPSRKPSSTATTNELPTTGFVTIKHCVENCGTDTAIFFNHDQLNNFRPKYRLRWNRLRIFGRRPPSPLPNVCSSSQTFYIRADMDVNGRSSLEGAFVWLPQGRLIYGNRQDKDGRTWVRNAANTDYVAASFEPIPPELLSSWWICDLNFRPAAAMKFIMPLFGNPDAVSAFLPGAYQDANNNLVSDLRFPVYPLIPRIRNAY